MNPLANEAWRRDVFILGAGFSHAVSNELPLTRDLFALCRQAMLKLGAEVLEDKDVMDTIQSLRSKAQKAGTLRTTEQQIVVVTNMVVEKTVEQQVVVVTNTVVQIQPSNPQVAWSSHPRGPECGGGGTSYTPLADRLGPRLE